MAKIGELDWSELKKSGVIQPEDPLSKPLPYSGTGPRLAKGEVPRKPTNEEIAKAILHNAPKQPTDEQLFGGGVVSEEEAAKRLSEWENKLQKSLTMPNLNEPLTEEEWGNCKSFNSTLSRKELEQRNMFTGE